MGEKIVDAVKQEAHSKRIARALRAGVPEDLSFTSLFASLWSHKMWGFA